MDIGRQHKDPEDNMMGWKEVMGDVWSASVFLSSLVPTGGQAMSSKKEEGRYGCLPIW